MCTEKNNEKNNNKNNEGYKVYKHKDGKLHYLDGKFLFESYHYTDRPYKFEDKYKIEPTIPLRLMDKEKREKILDSVFKSRPSWYTQEKGEQIKEYLSDPRPFYDRLEEDLGLPVYGSNGLWERHPFPESFPGFTLPKVSYMIDRHIEIANRYTARGERIPDIYYKTLERLPELINDPEYGDLDLNRIRYRLPFSRIPFLKRKDANADEEELI